MKLHCYAAIAACALLAACGGGDDSPTIPVSAFGAVGDSKTDNTKALQAALDAAGERPGSTVVFGPGTYMTGALFLRSHTTMQVDAGTTLMAIQAPTWWTLGAWAAEIMACAKASQGPRRGVGEAVWYAHTTSRQRRIGP